MSPTLLHLSGADVEAVGLPMSEVVDAVEEMFREKGAGRVEMPPKPGIHPDEDSFLHAMPAWIPGLKAAGIKWISAFPGNPARGLPYISGLLILNDPDTGLPMSVMDAGWVTAKRTGAASAVAARHLARPDSSTLGIVACGVQGRSHLEAMAEVFELERVHAFDIDRGAAERYADEMQASLGIPIEVVESAEDAVRGMDLVVTSGPILKNPDPTIQAGWLDRGAFASAVDFDSYWTGAALREIDRFATDDLAQMRYYREQEGYFSDTPLPYADLGQIVGGVEPGRRSEEERTMSMNLGLAAEDMATAVRVLAKARELGIGTELEL